MAVEPVRWIHGSEHCRQSNDSLLQVHKSDAQSVIMRVSKCFSSEANFIYLLFGRERALLLDTGGPADSDSAQTTLPIRETVDALVDSWCEEQGTPSIDLIVAHSHSHCDHVFGDRQFEHRAHTTIVYPTLEAVTGFFQLIDWPDGQAKVDLGERSISVFPIPGHESTHIALYDEHLKALLTGDTLYPGLLTVRDWTAYRSSVARLAQFTRANQVTYVLGAHIEMSKRPGELYPLGTTYQPNEHPLALTSAHLDDLHAACDAMGDSPHRTVRDSFIIEPL
jgi:hydroxyacylglutathione hydrolase